MVVTMHDIGYKWEWPLWEKTRGARQGVTDLDNWQVWAFFSLVYTVIGGFIWVIVAQWSRVPNTRNIQVWTPQGHLRLAFWALVVLAIPLIVTALWGFLVWGIPFTIKTLWRAVTYHLPRMPKGLVKLMALLLPRRKLRLVPPKELERIEQELGIVPPTPALPTKPAPVWYHQAQAMDETREEYLRRLGYYER